MGTFLPPKTRAISIVVSKRELLGRITRALKQRPLHYSYLFARFWVLVQEPWRVRWPFEEEAAVIELLAEAVHPPAWVRVGYRIAQDFGGSGFGSLRSCLLVCDAAFDAFPVLHTFRTLPTWFEFPHPPRRLLCPSVGLRKPRLLGRSALASSSARSAGLGGLWGVGVGAEGEAAAVVVVGVEFLCGCGALDFIAAGDGAVADGGAFFVGGEEGGFVDAGPQRLALGAEGLDGV
jgi:hypothetical protein